MPSLESQAELYFEGKQILCYNTACRAPLDYWTTTHRLLGEESATVFGLLLLGASHSEFSFGLMPEETFDVDLSKYNIPSNATVLKLSFKTPQPSPNCFPHMFYPELPVSLQTKFIVYGIPLVGTAQTKTSVSAEVTWVRNDDETFSWSHLVEAFQALASERYRAVILPAYMAFELSLTPLVDEAVKGRISNKYRDMFRSDLSSSLRLNLIVPLLAELAQAKPMPSEIQGEINALRQLRNKIVHGGVADTAVPKDEAQQLLCASVFGLEYLRYLRKRLFPTSAA